MLNISIIALFCKEFLLYLPDNQIINIMQKNVKNYYVYFTGRNLR